MFGAARLGIFDANPIGGKTYFTGGYSTAFIATVRTYNLTSGASASGSSFANARGTHGAFGNTVNGFVCGGYGASRFNTVRYFAFSTDINNSWTWVTGNNMPAAQNECRGSSSPTKGYMWGGYTVAFGKYNTQLTYSTGVWANGTALNWAVNTSYPGCHSNATTGIIIDGNTSANVPLNQRVLYTFADESNVYSSNTAYETITQYGATGNQSYMWTITGRKTTDYNNNSTAVVQYAIATGTYSLVSNLASAAATNQTDAAGNDYVGIYAGKWTGQATGTVAESEQAHNYSTNTTTQLSNYLIGNAVYTIKTEGAGAFNSVQIS